MIGLQDGQFIPQLVAPPFLGLARPRSRPIVVLISMPLLGGWAAVRLPGPLRGFASAARSSIQTAKSPWSRNVGRRKCG